MIILDVTVLASGATVGKKLGNPQTWSEESAASTPALVTPAMKPTPSPSSKALPQHTPGPGLDTSLLTSQMTHPIASLSPYQNK